MEDRHTLSEPRRNPSALEGTNKSPGWLVDIYRKGVEDPIDTIEISEETLPPRKKKGKIVWRLPSDYSRVPSFPVDERRRIMDLFKERKKNRRKNKGNNHSNSSGGSKENGNGSSHGHGSTHGSNIATHALNSLEAIDIASHTENGAGKAPNQTTDDQTNAMIGQKEEYPSYNSINVGSSLVSKKKKRKEKMKRRLSQDCPVKRDSHHSLKDSVDKEPHRDEAASFEAPTATEPSDPTIPTLPPGFHSSLSLDKDTVDAPSQNDSNGHQDLSHHSLSDTTDTNMSNHVFADPSLSLLAPLPGSRFITISERDRPPITPLSPQKSSLAIAAAKAFIDLYYLHITHALSSDLANFYTPHAQKSISVGGAHSVVATRADIILQLISLSGSIFVVRGVVSQDAYDSRGVHVLVTGVVQTSGVTSQFAHSISLVPVPEHGEFSFQIHNDALSLLTNDGILQNSNEIPSQTHGMGVETNRRQQQGFHEDRNLAPQRNMPHPPGLGL